MEGDRNMRVSDLLDRVHPADEYRLGIEDEEEFLASLELDVEEFGVSLEDFGAAEVIPQRQCAEPGCTLPPKPRKGQRGPEPKRCEEHTAERARHMADGGSKARRPYPPCCVQWQLDDDPGHTGKCPQCRGNRDESVEPAMPVSVREAEWLGANLGPEGWHIDALGPVKGWRSNRGPDEGRTRPGVHSQDPYARGDDKEFLDDDAARWLAGNDHWFTDSHQ